MSCIEFSYPVSFLPLATFIIPRFIFLQRFKRRKEIRRFVRN